MAITWKTIERCGEGEPVCAALCEPRLRRIMGKLKIDLPYDWAVAFLDINPRGNEITASEICAPMFTVARLTRAGTPQRSLAENNCIDCGLEIQWNISQPLKWSCCGTAWRDQAMVSDTHKSGCSHFQLKSLKKSNGGGDRRAKQRAWRVKKSAEPTED